MAGLSRLMLSTRVQTRKRCPLAKLSLMRVHAPLLVGTLRCWQQRAERADAFLPDLGAHREPFEAIEAVDPCVIYQPAFSPQQGVQSSIPIADPHSRQFPPSYPQRGLVFR